jgi:hypothetical protein
MAHDLRKCPLAHALLLLVGTSASAVQGQNLAGRTV